MSSSPPTTTDQVIPESSHCQSAVDFVRWATAQLELQLSEQQGVGSLSIPESDRDRFDGQAELKISLDGSASSGESVNLDGRLCKWLFERFSDPGATAAIRPTNQPTAVKDITQKLFDAYQVDGGSVHLGGCQLTDYPFLRLSFASENNDELRHIFVAHDGSSVSSQLATDLGLLQIEPILKLPPRIDEPALQSLMTAGRRVAAQSVTSRNPNATTVEPDLISVVWVKHASGTLNFTIGETTVSQPFSGWARLLTAQPYASPASGASGFHLAATEDGRIDTIEQIAACQQSGRRVLQSELVTCAVTGQRVVEEFTDLCAVSGKPCLTEQFDTCAKCQQSVSKLALDGGTCTACTQLVKIKKDDPRLVWILGEHPGLDRWKSWQLSETKSVYIAQASSWTKRILIVVDKESLAVHHLATAGKLGAIWTSVAESNQRELLA